MTESEELKIVFLFKLHFGAFATLIEYGVSPYVDGQWLSILGRDAVAWKLELED